MSVNIFYCSSYFVVFVLFVFVFYQCAPPPLFKKNPHATCMQGKLARISRLTPILFCSNLCITRNTMDGNNRSRTLIKKHPPPHQTSDILYAYHPGCSMQFIRRGHISIGVSFKRLGVVDLQVWNDLYGRRRTLLTLGQST